MTSASAVEPEPAVLAERDAALAVLRRAGKLVVVTHEHLDGDALGSLVAMHSLLTALGKDCQLFLPEDELPLPYEYRVLPLDGLITAPPSDVHERVAVFLDCGNIDRNPAADTLRPADGWEQLLNIDHHHDNTRFGSVNYVDPQASCTVEMIWDLLRTLDAELTPTIADALYVGLITDTGCFMYENTGPRAHLMAAELIAAGVDVHRTYQQVYEGVPFGKVMLLARGLSRTERYDSGRLTISQLSAEDFQQAGAEESYSEGVVDYLRSVRGTAIAAVVRDRLDALGDAAAAPDGARLRKVSLRACDPQLDVSVIARAQGGGGHRAAAGFTTALPWDELVAFLRGQLDEQLQSR